MLLAICHCAAGPWESSSAAVSNAALWHRFFHLVIQDVRARIFHFFFFLTQGFLPTLLLLIIFSLIVSEMCICSHIQADGFLKSTLNSYSVDHVTLQRCKWHFINHLLLWVWFSSRIKIFPSKRMDMYKILLMPILQLIFAVRPL